MQNTALRFAWTFPNLNPNEIEDPNSEISKRLRAWLEGSSELGTDGKPLAGDDRAGQPPITNVGFEAIAKNYQAFAGFSVFLRELKQKSVAAELASVKPADIVAMKALYDKYKINYDSNRTLLTFSDNTDFQNDVQGLADPFQKFIHDSIARQRELVIAKPKTASDLAQARAAAESAALSFAQEFPDLSPDDVQNRDSAVNKKIQAWLAGADTPDAGSRRKTYPLPNVELGAFLDNYHKLAGLSVFLRELKQKNLSAQIGSLPPGSIEAAAKLYDKYKINSDKDHTLLDLAGKKEFQNDYQQLPTQLRELIEKGLEGQANAFLAKLKVEGQKAQLDAQTIKYLSAVESRLDKAGIKTIDDIIAAEGRGDLQKIIDSQTDENGEPIAEEVRMKIMDDFAKQISLKQAAAQSIVTAAEASNAPQLARVTKMGLDIAEDVLSGNGGGIRGITQNLLGSGGGLGSGLLAFSNRGGGAGAFPTMMANLGLPSRGPNGGGFFGGMGRGMGHGGRRSDAGDMMPGNPAELVRLAMNGDVDKLEQLAGKMADPFTGDNNGRQPRPDQRAMEHPIKMAKAETKKPPTHVAAARHDISDV